MKVKYPTLIINSAFRGKPSLVGKVSQHEKGEAVDIQIHTRLVMTPKTVRLPNASDYQSFLDPILMQWVLFSGEPSQETRKSLFHFL